MSELNSAGKWVKSCQGCDHQSDRSFSIYGQMISMCLNQIYICTWVWVPPVPCSQERQPPGFGPLLCPKKKKKNSREISWWCAQWAGMRRVHICMSDSGENITSGNIWKQAQLSSYKSAVHIEIRSFILRVSSVYYYCSYPDHFTVKNKKRNETLPELKKRQMWN